MPTPAATSAADHRAKMGGTALGASDVVLRDGSTVHIRPVRAQDAEALGRFFAALGTETRMLRFFSAAPDLNMAVRWASKVDFDRRYSLVATQPGGDQIIAHAGWERDRQHANRAEAAVVVANGFQGRGLGTVLLAQLAQAANRLGVEWLTGDILVVNHRLLQVLRRSGFTVRARRAYDELVVEISTAFCPEALERLEQREQLASIAAVRALLAPRSVAVVGASRSRDTVGGRLFHNLLAAGFEGPVYPVNPVAPVVQSVLAYPSVGDIAGPVDLAVIAVPAATAAEVARECAAKGVRGLVVISAGFAETGARGAELQHELLGVCRQAGMRMIGPNCLGVVNTSPDVRMDATFGPIVPARGRVGFLSQSGALGLAIIDYANALGLGLSSFVSVGNKADIAGNDLLAYWEQDPDTDVILLYLESFGNPRRFARLARQVARSKPIVAVKSGRSAAGARATTSHTGALLAASDQTVDALFRQAGVIRTDTLEELFDVAALLANQPLPAGRRVGIITNAGGPGILCADACEAGGLAVVALSRRLRERLAGFLPPSAVTNPVGLLTSAPASDYRQALGLLLASGEVDAVIVVFVPSPATEPAEVGAAIQGAHAAAGGTLPVLAVLLSATPPAAAGTWPGIPVYRFPEDAAHALARAADYAAWLAEPEGCVPQFPEARRTDAAALLTAALAGGPRWLSPDEVARLLGCYQLPLAAWRLAADADEAAVAAAELGGPVALKAVAPGLVHKTEAGAVRLGLAGAGQVRQAATRMAAAVAAAGYQAEGLLVQEMAPPGVELLVGVVHDHSFGPVLACGAGGTAVELLHDVAVRITPLGDRDAAAMLRSLKTFPLLAGYRGTPGVDVGAVEDMLLRVAAMVEEHPEIAELDCNPVIASPDGAVVVDARVRVEEPTPPPPLGARPAATG